MVETENLEPVDYNNLNRVARAIVNGAAAAAIAEYDKLDAEGKNPSLWLDRNNHVWIVKYGDKQTILK